MHNIFKRKTNDVMVKILLQLKGLGFDYFPKFFFSSIDKMNEKKNVTLDNIFKLVKEYHTQRRKD
jgi:hypothetical protein